MNKDDYLYTYSQWVEPSVIIHEGTGYYMYIPIYNSYLTKNPLSQFIKKLVFIIYAQIHSFTLVNVNAPVVATTSWWLHFSAPVVA